MEQFLERSSCVVLKKDFHIVLATFKTMNKHCFYLNELELEEIDTVDKVFTHLGFDWEYNDNGDLALLYFAGLEEEIYNFFDEIPPCLRGDMLWKNEDGDWFLWTFKNNQWFWTELNTDGIYSFLRWKAREENAILRSHLREEKDA